MIWAILSFLGFVAWSVLILFFPSLAARFEAWISRAKEWSDPKPEVVIRYPLRDRLIAWFVLILAGYFSLVWLWSKILNPSPASFTQRVGSPQSVHETNPHLIWVLPIYFIAYGMALIVKPELNSRMEQARSPHRVVREDGKARKRGRVAGVLLVFGGIFLSVCILR